MTNRKRDIMKEIYFTKLNYFRNGFSSSPEVHILCLQKMIELGPKA